MHIAANVAINLNTRTAWKKRLQDSFLRCTYLTYNVENIDSERIVRARTARTAGDGERHRRFHA